MVSVTIEIISHEKMKFVDASVVERDGVPILTVN
jgi:hypothetical protein